MSFAYSGRLSANCLRDMNAPGADKERGAGLGKKRPPLKTIGWSPIVKPRRGEKRGVYNVVTPPAASRPLRPDSSCTGTARPSGARREREASPPDCGRH